MAILALLRDVSASQYLMITAACAVLAYIGVKSHTRIATGTAQTKDDDPDAPISVNYFPSRKCNYSCGFCFHTETSSYVLPTSEAKRGLRLLKDAGMRKLNIAGGEPFLFPTTSLQSTLFSISLVKTLTFSSLVPLALTCRQRGIVSACYQTSIRKRLKGNSRIF